MPLFARITVGVAAGLMALLLVAFVLKILIFAAVVAALVVAGLAVVRFFRRRSGAITLVGR